MTELPMPGAPPILTSELPPVTARLGSAPEDFCVDELSAYPLSGAGEHLFVRVRKRLLTTQDATHALARAAGVEERDVGCAGMKDKHAVTTQWFSLPARGRAPDAWKLPQELELVEATRHSNKLRTGQLGGNRFRLTLVGAEAGDLERAGAIADHLRAHGLVNYFGPQRFGRDGQNLPRALEWLRRGAVERGKQARFHRKLYPSVIQAEVFNRYATRRAAAGLEQLLEGEVVRLAASRAVFVVEDAGREQPRLTAREIRLTGPMIGPKARAASAHARLMEQGAIDALGLGEGDTRALGSLADGTRRDIVVWPEGLSITAAADARLVVEFALPPGSYATQLLRELTHTSWAGESAHGES